MKIILLLFFSHYLFLFSTLGQEVIDTDRPDQTESATVIPKKYFQAEVGFNIEEDEKARTIVHPTALWKYGLNNKIEFRLITEIVSDESAAQYSNDKYKTGLLPVQIGSKISLWEERNFVPKTSLIFHVGIPVFSSPVFKPPHLATNFRFASAHTLAENIGLGYNIGAEWDGGGGPPAWIYTLAPGFSIGKNCYGYLELFGAIKKKQSPEHSLDGGFAYNFSNNSKIDISAGFGISETAVDHYFALGFSFRFDTKKSAND
jgi:hypothetical protein